MKNQKSHISAIIAIVVLLATACNERKRESVKVQTSSNDKKIIFGYRFKVVGDFNGDGKREKLTEYYTCGFDNKETHKFENIEDYEKQVDLAIKKNPKSFLLSDNNLIDTLQISSGGQVFGISYLKNEGDLNGDGTDEISYVIDYADFSNLNSWHIMTYKDNKWQEIYTFPIWDWQLPNLPVHSNRYALFGTESKDIETSEDTTTEWELYAWEGLVRKIKTNKIEVVYRNDEANKDTMVVHLKNVQKRK